MNQEEKELTLEESIQQVMQTLPPFIQDYLRQGKYTPVALSLTKKYGLRIDQSGILERELMLLLMGIENPVEFMGALRSEAHLDQGTVDNIVQDLNIQVFIPLREEERRQSSVPVALRAKPAPAFVPVRPVATPTTPPQATAPVVAAPKATLAPVASRPISPLGDVVRKALESNKMLADHEEPHIEVQKPVTPPTPPAVPVRPASVPVSAPVAPAVPAPVAPPAASVRPTPASVPPRPATPPVVSVPSYTADPYREPIDEKGV